MNNVDAAPAKVGQHAAWAMAVGGMIGGGIYTLAGVIVGLAGPWAWASIVTGALIALATVHSYAQLTITTNSTGVPVTIFSREGHKALARFLAWGLLAVYVLSLAVYMFTVGHYVGRALGFGSTGIIAIEATIVGVLTVLNLLKVESSARVQIAMVWAELAVLAALAALGFWHWRPENLSLGVTKGSVGGVIVAAASTFIAFEGFEMLAYDLREMERPHRIMLKWLPAAVLAVAAAYIVVTIGAASLVGARTLVTEEETALAAAGHAAGGTAGVVVVTVAAFAAATSAINATLFSAARLARTAANHGLLPRWCAVCNTHDAPMWSMVAIGIASLVVAAISPLEPLVAVASVGFLSLFCLVNLLALLRTRTRRWVAALGAAGAGGAVVAIVATLGR